MALLTVTHWTLYTPCFNIRWLATTEKERERKGQERERAIVCSPLPPHFLLHSSGNDISSPPKEVLSLFLLKLSLALSFLCQISLTMELFVLPYVPSHTTHTLSPLQILPITKLSVCAFQDATKQPTGETSPWCSMESPQPPVVVSVSLTHTYIHTHTHTLIMLPYLIHEGMKYLQATHISALTTMQV